MSSNEQEILTTKIYIAPNISSSKVEKPRSTWPLVPRWAPDQLSILHHNSLIIQLDEIKVL